jgi:hypothetical protein
MTFGIIVVNLQHACCTNVTHISSYVIEATPFTSFSAKTS